MPGLDPGIHAFVPRGMQDVDGRDKPGHDVDGLVLRRRSVGARYGFIEPCTLV